ncbi:hypothetical protein PT2222_250094 [Paraburkholderia tropica]
MAQTAELTEGQQAGKAFHDSLQRSAPRGAKPALTGADGFLEFGGPDQTDGNAFEREVGAAGLHEDVVVVGVLRDQFDAVGLALQTLHGDVVAQTRHDDLAVFRFGFLLHGEQVAVEDAGVAHRQPAHLQQIVGAAGEQRRVAGVVLRDMFLREDRAACRDAPDQRQRELHDAGVRQRELVRQVVGAGHQTDAARGARRKLDHTFAGQRAQMLFRRVGRAEAQFGGDLGARGRKAGALDRAADQIENLLLSCGEFGHVDTVCLNR